MALASAKSELQEAILRRDNSYRLLEEAAATSSEEEEEEKIETKKEGEVTDSSDTTEEEPVPEGKKEEEEELKEEKNQEEKSEEKEEEEPVPEEKEEEEQPTMGEPDNQGDNANDDNKRNEPLSHEDNTSATRKQNSNNGKRKNDNSNSNETDGEGNVGTDSAVIPPELQQLRGISGNFDLSKLVVSDRYDKSFVTNVKITNIKQLKMTEGEDSKETINIKGDISKFTAPAREIIVGVLLWITVPNVVNTVHVVRKFGGKKSGAEVKYKRIFNIADLTNTRETGGVFSIMECSNADSSTLFFQDKEKREIGIGSKLIITCPKYGGKLKMGTSIISTSYPLQVFKKPAVPCKPCVSGKEQEDAGWFCLKNVRIAGLAGRAPVPFSSICNGETCDRAKSFGNKNPCACFHQLSRKEGGVRNVCFKFDFGFPNSDGDEIIKTDFTSLRTTRMFFRGQSIQNTEEDLNKGSVLELVHSCFYKVVEYINRNGGWTVMGHYIRAEQKDKKPDTPYDNQEEKNSLDVKAYHSTMLHNVDYLYPTTCKPSDIPVEYLITKQGVDNLLMDATPEDTRNDEDDLL